MINFNDMRLLSTKTGCPNFYSKQYTHKKGGILLDTSRSFLYSIYQSYYNVNEIRSVTKRAKIAYNSGNTAITIVTPNTSCPAPTPTIPLAQT
jgi:hypothetical protein